MIYPKLQPVSSIENLRERVDRFFRATSKNPKKSTQYALNLFTHDIEIDYPSKTVSGFLNFITDSVPDGDVYLFGGVLRDLALLGKKGFSSDIDLVVEGSWSQFVDYLESLHATKNKFGGYRLVVEGWPIDIWNARETWAIKQGLVEYNGIASLTNTTVLNWDAILMNWRTRNFIYRNKYIEEIKGRILDIVLEENPNPMGMAVRVFRHLCLKDAKKVTINAAIYLAKVAAIYNYDDIVSAEIKSYGTTVIRRDVYKFFSLLDASDVNSMQRQFCIADAMLDDFFENETAISQN